MERRDIGRVLDSVTVVRGPFLEGAPVEECIVSNSSSTDLPEVSSGC